MALIYIYGLVDPRSSLIRYVGKSIRPKERLQNHMKDRSSCHRSHWLQELRREGLVPEIVYFQTLLPDDEWQPVECFWIARGRALGWPLTNNTSGGDGVSNLPPETRARMAAVWKGRKHSPETIEKLRNRPTRKASQETRAKMSAKQKGRVIAWADKLSVALRKISDEDMEAIKRRLAAGELGRDLAAEFGVHRTTLSKIKMGTYHDKYRRN